MKNTKSFGNGFLLARYYGDYAAYIVHLIKALDDHGVLVSFVSVQNEPDRSGGAGSCTDATCLGACRRTAANLDAFIKNNLGPCFLRIKRR